MQPDCVCKARFFSKMFRFQRKIQLIPSRFHSFPQTFRRLSTAFSTICGKTKSPEILGIFLGIGNLSQPVFHENPIFVSTVSTCDFLKIFSVPFSSSFPQNFPQVFLFNSTIFQLFKMSNVLSTFPHKFNNCIVEKNQQFRHFSDFSTVSTAPTTTTNFFNLSILSKRHTQNRKYHGNCGNFPQFLDDTDRNRALNCPFQ